MGLQEAVAYALSGGEPTTLALLAPDQPMARADPPSLTHREGEIAALVARGLTNRQIASELGLSKHTVHHHVTNILKKLNLTSREQVASYLQDQ